MKAKFIIAASLLAAASFPAFAQTEPMTDGRYMAASRCVAYAQLAQLQGDGFDISPLAQAVDDARPNYMAEQRADSEASDIRRAGRRAGDNAGAIQILRERRDEACAGFVSNGTLQAAAPAPAPAS
ncbi:MAG: hypothetical protein NW206_12275 [Hyphomonadaceae bacterium]|nr:hypothetical protein [Hyphomonadaceae bacterium]